MLVSEQLGTYPSSNQTLTLTCYQLTIAGLREALVRSCTIDLIYCAWTPYLSLLAQQRHYVLSVVGSIPLHSLGCKLCHIRLARYLRNLRFGWQHEWQDLQVKKDDVTLLKLTRRKDAWLGVPHGWAAYPSQNYPQHFIHPLTHRSDWHVTPPCTIHTLSSKHVKRELRLIR